MSNMSEPLGLITTLANARTGVSLASSANRRAQDPAGLDVGRFSGCLHLKLRILRNRSPLVSMDVVGAGPGASG
jgi:hypothetical protein